MVRVILAAAGVLFIVLGVNLDIFDFIWFGILLILPAAITVIIKIVKKLIENGARRRERKKEDARLRAEWEAKEKKKLSQLKVQEDLIESFKIGMPIKRLIADICNDSPNHAVPEEITIFDDRVEVILQGSAKVFNFSSYGIREFPVVCEFVERKGEMKYVVKPQLALAEALNTLLSDQYIIYDHADENNRRTLYTSKYVTLYLIPK